MESANKIGPSSDQNNSLCRVCLSAHEDNKCIFTFHVNVDHETYNPTDLCEKLQYYGGIKVSQNDGLPAKMCYQCISKMRVAHEFRMQCQVTDKMLRSVYSNTANRNDSTSRCCVKGVEDEVKREYARSDEIGKLEDLYRDELNIDRAVDISGPCQVLQNSDKEISSCINNVEDFKPVLKKNVSRTNTILVLKRVTSNMVKKPCHAFKKSPVSLTVESRCSRSINRDSINDIHLADIAKTKRDKLVLKKEGYQSQRMILFKRVTSMTYLNINKERQRQHIKKTSFPKLNSIDRDNVQNSKTLSTGVPQLPDTISSLPHKCSKCGRSYSSKTALESHEDSHEYQKLSCQQYDDKFSQVNVFVKHAKTHDFNEKLKTANCKICNKNFRKAVTMVRHLNVHKRQNPRAVYSILKDIRDRKKGKNVKLCEEVIANTENLKDKIVLHDGQDTRIARELRKNTSYSQGYRGGCIAKMTNADLNSEDDTKPFIKRYSSRHNEVKSMCNVCDIKFLAADKIKSHREHCKHYENNVSREQSPPDDRSAIKLINIWIKEELDSDKEGKGFPCKNCNKSYGTKKSLLKHEAKIHANIVIKHCPRCGEDCICTNRIKENHKETLEKAYICEECNKTFQMEVKLDKHMRIHARTKEQQDRNFKRFLCHICSKTFRQNTGLMFHMRTHTGYKPHVCKYCGRGFTSNSNCINHERTHTGDRPFVCHFCSAAFAKSCTLKAHITTHTGEANYHCKTCGKSFRRLKYLKEHRFTHTGEKPYACKICGTAYSHSGSLFVHEKKCKALERNYQAVSVPVSQNHCQPLTATIGASSIAPIIRLLPSSHHIISIDNPVTADATNNCIESVRRMNRSVHPASNSAEAHIHLSPIHTADVIGQIFHT